MTNIIYINIKNEKSIREHREKQRGTRSTLYHNPTFSKEIHRKTNKQKDYQNKLKPSKVPPQKEEYSLGRERQGSTAGRTM
jgi:hypothetical protein